MRAFWSVMKWVIGIGLVLLLVLGGAGVFLYKPIKKMVEEMSSGKQGTEVRTQHVARGRLVRTVSAPGAVEPRTKVSISARVAAEIVQLPFREGDTVRAGDVVVRLDAKELAAGVESAEAGLKGEEARLEGARASHVNSVAEWERQKSLFTSNDVSKSLLESADAEMKRQESNLQAAGQSIEMARARLTQARENLRYATIESPINGRVTKLNAEVGELVVTGTMNNAGTVIMEVADLSEMLVTAEVSESDVAPVKTGQASRVHINAYPGEVFEGVVEKVALQHTLARDGTKYFETEVLIRVPDDRTLYRGLTANVDIEVEAIEGVVLAPSQAVIDMRVDELPAAVAESPNINREKTFARIVYAIKDGKATALVVQVGASDLTKTVVLAGIADGDEIITGPWATLKSLKHDQLVHRAEEKKPAADQTAKETGVASAEGEAKPAEGQPAQDAEKSKPAEASASKEEKPKPADGASSGGGSSSGPTRSDTASAAGSPAQ